MTITVVGSVAFDTIQTPFGKAERVLGGSATYFSVAASFFTPVQLVAVVGGDFSNEDMKIFAGRQIDTSGLMRVEGGKTFHWSGEYGFDLNVAKTRDTQLNVFADFQPQLPENFRNADILFLANIAPELQYDVLQQCGGKPRLVALDTMNYWISSKRPEVEKVMGEVDLVIINEGELRELMREPNLIAAAKKLLGLGPETLVVKRGEYGSLMVRRDRVFAAPAYPLESVFDPTGAGDTFAGGFLGYLASAPSFDESELRKATIFGSVLASFNVEAFSLDRLRNITRTDIDRRYREIRELTHFEDLPAQA